ncbi:L,D-transpeptidase family protein [Nocardioides sp. SYSU D00038]|uniref:L,D-transpeptidase family protein n=1 Tax=Nocardioides sp. SYSU D00038 TaxID=2812554 RepID=UPI001F074226|nr:L,D-transpeptidase family protein [Nocardioides sp. SYSU D00038]
MTTFRRAALGALTLLLVLASGSLLTAAPATADEIPGDGATAAPTFFAKPGDQGIEVRRVQARLKQRGLFVPDVSGFYGPETTAAVRVFQRRNGFPVTGKVNKRTIVKLRKLTRAPGPRELHARGGSNRPGRLDGRCRTGRVLCIDKSSRTIRWMVGGRVVLSMDVRFGSSATPTREGVYSVFRKSRDHVSSLYGSAMPFAMFFSGGQAVHYSSDFAAVGYNGASHGCVNVRNRPGIEWLYDQVRTGDRVVVYWS